MVNILADFTEDGIDKNEPHIVPFTDNIYIAGMAVKRNLESRGYVVQSLTVVKGCYTLDELHNMAQYGDGLEAVDYRLIYVSNEMAAYMKSIENNPVAAQYWEKEIERRKQQRNVKNC